MLYLNSLAVTVTVKLNVGNVGTVSCSLLKGCQDIRGNSNKEIKWSQKS